jgi:hypothetical protein
MPEMKRTLVTIVTISFAALLGPAAASAKLSEIGTPTVQGKPSCPTNPCLAVSRTTGFQVQGGRVKNPYLVPRRGAIVAFTVALGKPSTRQITFFNTNLGGPASARITVLRAFARRGNNFRFVVRSQGEVVNLQPYFGQTAQFALSRSIGAYKGDLIALTVPTWAPVLALGLDNATTWRASRPKPCADNEAFQQFAQQRVTQMAQYACEYKTARMTYSATLISTP